MRTTPVFGSALVAAALLSAAAGAQTPSPSPSAGPAISVVAKRSSPSGTTTCPATVNFSADITASNWPATSARQVQYHWQRSDGTTVAAKPIVFDANAPVTQTVTLAWTLTATVAAGYVSLVVDAPVQTQSNDTSFAFYCNGATSYLGTPGDGSGAGASGVPSPHAPGATPDPVATRPIGPPTSNPAPTQPPLRMITPPPVMRTPAPLSITMISAVNKPAKFSPCPLAVPVTATVTALNWPRSSNRTISYHWVSAAGARTVEENLVYPAGATKENITTVVQAGAGDHSETLWIDAPVAVTSLINRFSVVCPPSGNAILDIH